MDFVRRGVRLLLIFVVIIIGVGFVVPITTIWLNHTRAAPTRYELHPAPWLVPKQAGGSALRLAMIHDVLHERFYLHGEAWFRHRHTQVERELATYEDGSKAKDARYFTLLDDLAVDFDRLGKPAEGIPILRRKLDLQQPLTPDGQRPPPERAFYTTYANLGTLLAHQHLKGALAKDPTALAGLREGLALIEQSVAVNPDAHFGRERWQVVTLRYLLYASEHPDILTTFDLTGFSWADSGAAFRSYTPYPFGVLTHLPEDEYTRLVAGPRSPEDETFAERIRESIPVQPSPEKVWQEHLGQGLGLPTFFDEPALAMVGIWTLGSGANPHFALVFAHLMEGLNQPAIAWNAYERTSDLAGKFWGDPAVQKRVIDHCRARQAVLEKMLAIPATALREQHRSELAHGRAEQQAYQTHEAERITAGQDPATPGFYDDFFRGRPAIASDPGNADTIARAKSTAGFELFLILQAIVCSVLSGLLLLRIFSLKKQLAA